MFDSKGIYMARPASDPVVRFLQKTQQAASGCLEWTSVIHRDGYGKFYFEGQQAQTHRVAYRLFVGEIPKGKCVLHKCDNRKCVNVEHLYVGDHKQNVADMYARGRNVGRAKFGTALIEECKTRYSRGESQQAIADQLGLHQTTVSRFIRNRYLTRH